MCIRDSIGSVHKLKDIDLGLVDYPDEIIPGRVRENLAMLYELADRYDYDLSLIHIFRLLY